MALFAPALWAFDGIVRTGGRRDVVPGAVSYGALLLSHLFHALVFTPVLVGYVLLQLLVRRSVRRIWLIALGAGVLALLLSAFFWLPALGERSLTRTAAEQYIATSDFHQRFLSWARLLAPPAPLDL